MAFRELAGQGEVTISLGGTNKKTGKTNPTSVEGYYLGSRTVDQNGTDSTIHQFQTSKGNVDVWGKTDLNRKLSSVEPGTMVRATFTGTRPIPGKPQPMYTFKVEADDANTLDLSATGEGTTAGFDEGESDIEDDRLPDEIVPERLSPPKGYTKASVGTQKAKELLSKRG